MKKRAREKTLEERSADSENIRVWWRGGGEREREAGERAGSMRKCWRLRKQRKEREKERAREGGRERERAEATGRGHSARGEAPRSCEVLTLLALLVKKSKY